MKLAVKPPFLPMEARLVDEIPTGKQWQYEPKWDGFRCLAFRDANSLFLQSKSGQPLARYFPEVVEMLKELPARRFVLDGELMIPIGGRSSFDDLLMRIHPAASRVKKLSAEHPAWYVVFDLLVDEENESLVDEVLAERRQRLERFAAENFQGQESIRLSPVTTTISQARRWFASTGASLDGIIAKQLDLAYLSGSRDGMQKVKRKRTADCVIGGFRYREGTKDVGSLLLGLYTSEGVLNHVGFTAAFDDEERKRLTKLLRPLKADASFTGKTPGAPSRWSTKRSMEWQPVKPNLVVEVEYDHFTGERFRHGTKLLRFRPDKKAKQCTYDQLGKKRGAGLALLKPKRKTAKSA